MIDSRRFQLFTLFEARSPAWGSPDQDPTLKKCWQYLFRESDLIATIKRLQNASRI